MSAPRKTTLTDRDKLERIHDLEGDFYAVADAAGVVWDLLEGLFDGSQTPGITPGDRPDLHSLDRGRLDRLHYAVSDAWSKASKLNEDLHAALGYSPDA